MIETRNDEVGFVEFLNDDVTTITREIDGQCAILLDMNTRQIVGYRVYDPASKPVAAAEVRPLEWTKSNVADRWTAQHAFGQFEINRIPYKREDGCQFSWMRGIYSEYFITIEDAKSTAEADYRQRILSTLSLPAQEPAATTGSAAEYSRAQLAKLAFAIYYSSNLCAPQNIASVIEEVDTCGSDCEYVSGSTCHREEQGKFCPFSVAEDLRQLSAALYGPKPPNGYVESVFGPDQMNALCASPQPEAVITEEMVERGARALHANSKGKHNHFLPFEDLSAQRILWLREDALATLTAALKEA